MTKEYSLPYDYSRCNGSKTKGELHPTCVDCLRRLSPGRENYQSYFMGIVLEDGTCKDKIGRRTYE